MKESNTEKELKIFRNRSFAASSGRRRSTRSPRRLFLKSKKANLGGIPRVYSIFLNSLSAFSLVEIVIAMGIFTLFSVGIVYLSLDTLQRDLKNQNDTTALYYAQEGLEAVRQMRNSNYLAVTNGDHGLRLQNDAWSFIAAPETVGTIYSRTITIEDVRRDSNGNIATEGTIDSEIKKVSSKVTWNLREVVPRSITLYSYLTNWAGEDWLQTTCTELNNGSFSNTETTDTTGPPTGNCALKLTSEAVASEFFESANLGKHANDVDVDGNYAYLATADSQKGFAIVDITDPTNPQVSSELDVTSKGRNIHKAGNRAYIGIESSNPGLGIIDTTNPSQPSTTYSINIGGYGNEPEVIGDYLYMGVKTNGAGFLVYDLTPSPSLTDSLDFDEDVQAIEVVGNYAYVGLSDDHYGLRIVNITNPSNISQASQLDVDEEVNAIAITGAIAFVGVENAEESLQVVNITNPASPQIVTSLDVNGEIQDLVIAGDYLYAALDDENEGLAAINISNPLAPALSYTLDINAKGTGIDAKDSYLFIATNTSNDGMIIVGTTTNEITTSGDYTSQNFDTGSESTRYNFIEWNHVQVPGGSVKFRIRTANSSPNLNSATWVGSDGTANTYYQTSRTPIVLDPNRTGVRYIQWKAYFTSDGATSPSIESVRINYNS